MWVEFIVASFLRKIARVSYCRSLVNDKDENMIVLWKLKKIIFWLLFLLDNEAEKKETLQVIVKKVQATYLFMNTKFISREKKLNVWRQRAYTTVKKHVIYELFAYLPLLRRMLKNKKKYFVDIFILFVFEDSSLRDSLAFIGDFHWIKKITHSTKHQQTSRKMCNE